MKRIQRMYGRLTLQLPDSDITCDTEIAGNKLTTQYYSFNPFSLWTSYGIWK
jgi:hypothetical protein